MEISIKTKWLSIILILALNIVTLSCGNSGPKSEQAANDETVEPSTAQAATTPVDDPMLRGETVYNESCSVCHQEDGSGYEATFPPLIKSQTVSGDHSKLIKVILEGMDGVEINGVKYNSSMPSQKDDLTDQQIADVLNFLRKSFENSGDLISVEEVSSLRE